MAQVTQHKAEQVVRKQVVAELRHVGLAITMVRTKIVLMAKCHADKQAVRRLVAVVQRLVGKEI
jgi:hypothetical protein